MSLYRCFHLKNRFCTAAIIGVVLIIRDPRLYFHLIGMGLGVGKGGRGSRHLVSPPPPFTIYALKLFETNMCNPP